MKRVLLILPLLISMVSVYAAHIAGGELQYRYIGPGSTAGTDRFEVTMRLFRECSSNGPQLVNEIVNVGAYGYSSNVLVKSVTLPLVSGISEIRLKDNIPCLVGSPDVCYQVAIYSSEIELPRTPDGYRLAWGRCCRANGLMNAAGSGNIGATYLARIPGIATIGTATNSSPQFVVKDTALVCGGNDFVLDFGAYDAADGDSLSYAFCDAYNFAQGGNQSAPPPSVLSLQVIPYSGGYSGSQPLGPTVIIDPATGIISGVAPSTPGRYVVNVCVTEWRNGAPISEHRKDFILKVGDCNIIAAKLKPQYINCDNYTSLFQNEANSSQINSYFWDFGVNVSLTDTSNVPQPTFTFPDTGTYRVMLIINRNQDCSDTATAQVKVYPGFNPGFSFTGSCYQNPFRFTDTTYAKYGTVNSWRWDFGENALSDDTSRLRNPTFQYTSTGTRQVNLLVSSDKGCSGVVQKDVNVLDKPVIGLPFRDTLICSIDSLTLFANGTGSFTWSPNDKMINGNTASPVVYPKDTTLYYVELNDNGCKNKDSVKVNVLKTISVELGADTAICQTDSIKMTVVSHALSYSWSPATGLSSTSVKSPLAAPNVATKYYVRANLGKCEAKDSVVLRVSPYPLVSVSGDTAICFGDKVRLSGSVTANGFSWSPSNAMANPGSLQPLAGPSKTTLFILTAKGNEECPKWVSDSVLVTVIPPIKAFAGNDTVVTGDQPLVLHASGGENYSWSPELYINNSSVPNPVVTLSNHIDSITYRLKVTTADGCSGEDDIKIVVFKTGPQIFVPDAFTPNHDGRNDGLYPVLVGMKQLDFFRVYNRYGQLLFSTSEIGKKWDGSFGGKEQPTGTFVYIAQAINYKGETVLRKGTVLLIR